MEVMTPVVSHAAIQVLVWRLVMTYALTVIAVVRRNL